MPSGPFTKQNIRISVKLNYYLGDAIVGGLITSAPSGLAISQGQQTMPGDRIILNAVDALALSDTVNVTTSNLWDGLYIYVRTKATSTLTPTLGRLAFWDTGVAESIHQVTPDESGAQGVALCAGVFVSTMTKGYNWWIQAAGLANIAFTTPLTGVPTDGCPVYAAADAAGRADVLDGGGAPSFTQIGQMLQRYLGDAVGLPAAATTSTVDMRMNRMFRW
jgi:hypothetical protein